MSDWKEWDLEKGSSLDDIESIARSRVLMNAEDRAEPKQTVRSLKSLESVAPRKEEPERGPVNAGKAYGIGTPLNLGWSRLWGTVQNLKVLSEEEYQFLKLSDPGGLYDRKTREVLYLILAKLIQFKKMSSLMERAILKKFGEHQLGLWIKSGTRATGTLKLKGSVCIDGSMDGPVHVGGTLIVRKDGRVIGEVDAERVICEGRLYGPVRARDRIEIRPSGMLVGDVRTPTLNIEMGAEFEGRCLMTPEPENRGDKEDDEMSPAVSAPQDGSLMK